jgi:hypothetical protein
MAGVLGRGIHVANKEYADTSALFRSLYPRAARNAFHHLSLEVGQQRARAQPDRASFWRARRFSAAALVAVANLQFNNHGGGSVLGGLVW